MILYIFIYLLIIGLLYNYCSLNINITILSSLIILLLIKKNYESFDGINQIQETRNDILSYIKTRFLTENQEDSEIIHDSIKIHSSCPKIIHNYNTDLSECTDTNKTELNGKYINRNVFAKIVNDVYQLQ